MIFIIFSFAFNSALKSQKSKCLCGMLMTYCFLLLADLVSRYYQGDVQSLPLRYAAITTNLVMDNVMTGAFVVYCRMDLKMKKADWYWPTVAIGGVVAIFALLALVNPVTHHYVYISPETGEEIQQPLFLISGVTTCLIFCACLIEILSHKEARWQNRASLAFYCIAHLVTITTQPWVGGTTVVNLATLVSLLVLYTNFFSEQNQRFSQQEMELQNARAALVLSQIQPHFLFNSMAVVMDLCDTNPQEAKAALQELSDYLHYKITAMSNAHLVTVAEDMEFLQNYLKLEKRRYGSRLTVEYDIGADDFLVPLLTLQPLVENAIRHGISKRPEGGTVRITTRKLEDADLILVEDNGVGFDIAKEPDSSREHIGLHSVKTRLAALCGGTLTVRSTLGQGTAVEIIIKKKEREKHENPGR